MSYDLNILCVNQCDVSKQTAPSSIVLKSELDDPGYYGRYHSIWPFMCSIKGIWYSIDIDDDEDYWISIFKVVDADFDKEIDRNLMPFWIEDEGILSNLSPLIVHDEYMSDFQSAIKFLIQQSPDKTVMFLARYQGGETEITQGVLK